MDDELTSYRNHLVQSEQKSLEAYDKSLLALSGGALGISFAFINEIIGPGEINSDWLLVTAWACWVATMGGTITSFYVSHLALRRAIQQVDNKRIYVERPGGRFSAITNTLNAVSGGLFLLGLVFIVIFASVNMGSIQ